LFAEQGGLEQGCSRTTCKKVLVDATEPDVSEPLVQRLTGPARTDFLPAADELLDGVGAGEDAALQYDDFSNMTASEPDHKVRASNEFG